MRQGAERRACIESNICAFLLPNTVQLHLLKDERLHLPDTVIPFIVKPNTAENCRLADQTRYHSKQSHTTILAMHTHVTIIPASPPNPRTQPHSRLLNPKLLTQRRRPALAIIPQASRQQLTIRQPDPIPLIPGPRIPLPTRQRRARRRRQRWWRR